MILDGKKVSEKIYTSLKESITQSGAQPHLWVVLIWWDDSPSMRYIHQKRKACEKIGIDFSLFQFPIDVTQVELESHIQKLNNDNKISGYIVQLPLPNHICSNTIIELISPLKDVDGFHPINQWKVLLWDETGLVPCTPKGVIRLIKEYWLDLNWKNLTVIGRSNIAGKPLAALCINAGATVSVCNSQTKDISYYLKNSDIIIAAAGSAELVKAKMVKTDAVLIDVGFSIIEGKIYGDIEYSSCIAQWNSITPVPGWVGPMTVSMLMENTLLSYQRQHV